MIAPPSTTSLPVDTSPKPFGVIYSLHYDVAPLPDDPRGAVTALVVPLDRTGNSANPKSMVQPRDRGKRIIDLRIGDELLVAGKWRTITRVSAYREHWLTAERATVCREGYLYTSSAHRTSYPISTSARKSGFQPAICIFPRMLSFIG